MNSRERVYRTLRFEHPDRPPRQLWTLPGVDMYRKADVDAVRRRFPPDLVSPPHRLGESSRVSGTPNAVGTYVDEWGSVWRVAEPGVIGEVKVPVLADWSALATYELPYERLRGADFSAVNPFCAETDQFVIGGTDVRPFERMQFLRGTEDLFMDLALGVDEVIQLRDRLHAYYLEELALWTLTDVDAISFLDDWGAQKGLLINPKLWRELFRPLYAEYVQVIHAAGKFVFMHSDGDISAIYPDLIEIGIDAINSQLFCMDIEALGREYKGKITFWGEIDRQWALPFGTPDDVRAAVRRVRDALDDGSGGVIGQCEFGINDPLANIEAVFEAWL